MRYQRNPGHRFAQPGLRLVAWLERAARSPDEREDHAQ